MRALFPQHHYLSLEDLDLRGFVKTIRWWEELEGNRNQGGTVIFGGREPHIREGFSYRPWSVSF